MSQTKWKLSGSGIVQRDADYTCTFNMLNENTGALIALTMTQARGGPASDLIGALRAMTVMLMEAAGVDVANVPPLPTTTPEPAFSALVQSDLATTLGKLF